MGALVSAGVVESGGTVRFTHPILRAAIYADLSPAERERLHRAAATILRDRGAPVGQVAAQVVRTEPAGEQGAVALLRSAAGEALALGDAAGAAELLSRALDEPPADVDRAAVVLELGQAHARAGAPEAIAPLSEIVERGDDAAAIAAAAIELSGMLFYAGRAAEGAAILRRGQERLPPGDPAREQLEIALLGISYTSASARREGDASIAARRNPGDLERGALQATTLAALAMDEVMFLRSASTAIDLAERALAAGLPLEPGRGENWAILALASLTASDGLDAAVRAADEILPPARARGAALMVAIMRSALRALPGCEAATSPPPRRTRRRRSSSPPTCSAVKPSSSWPCRRRCSQASSATRPLTPCADSSTAAARGTTPSSCRAPSCAMPSACSAPPRATTKRRSRNCAAARSTTRRSAARTRPCSRGDRQRLSRWPSRPRRRGSQPGGRRGAPGAVVRRATGDRYRAARPGARRTPRATAGAAGEALAVLAPSPARLEHARVPVDLGATHRAAGQRSTAREPLLEGLELAARCGARSLERRRGQSSGRSASGPGPPTRRGGLADAQRAARGRARRDGRHEPGDRPDAVRHREDGGDPPRTIVPQARHLVAATASRRARTRRRLTAGYTCSGIHRQQACPLTSAPERVVSPRRYR